MNDDARIVLVEFSDGRPFSVVTMDQQGGYDHYDFDWCERDECFLWHSSSNCLYLEGADNDYWACPDLEEEVLSGGGEKPTGKRFANMPAEWPLESLFDGEEREAVYCSICKDHLPESEGDICDHVRWCETCNWWSGEGYEEGHCAHVQKEIGR